MLSGRNVTIASEIELFSRRRKCNLPDGQIAAQCLLSYATASKMEMPG
jgi:hypothetical protein